MSKKRHIVHVWFLDNDLQKSAQMLTDDCLKKTIDGCIGCLVSTTMYLVGIRSKTFYSHFFSKDNIKDTLSIRFYSWPLNKRPSFMSYSWKESRWCRMCQENCRCILEYLEALMDEYSYRHSSMHPAYPIIQWAESNDAIQNLPSANLSQMTLPWKSIDPRFRSNDIIESYRNQYCATQIENGDPFLAYARCKRDIPQFVVDTFHLQETFEK